MSIKFLMKKHLFTLLWIYQEFIIIQKKKTAFMIACYNAGPLTESTDRIEVKKINGAWKIINCKNLRVS